MQFLRSCLVWIVVVSLAAHAALPLAAAQPPIGILTLATHAHLADAEAFPGLSVFEGESLSTDAEGSLAVRAGHANFALGGKSEAAIVPLNGGLHVDMYAGSLHFSVPENEPVELHALEAIIRPATSQTAQGSILILGPKILQITAVRGSLNFTYHEEFRNLPEGQTYRIYLDAPADSGDPPGTGAAKAGAGSKVAYFILGTGLAGMTAWSIHEALRTANAPISPAKP